MKVQPSYVVTKFYWGLLLGRKRKKVLRKYFSLRSTSGPLPVHLGPLDGHMTRPIIQFYKKMNITKFVDIGTYGRKKVTPKDPFRVYARDLKKPQWYHL